MAQYYQGGAANPPYGASAASSSSANNLQFYSSNYSPAPPVSGHATPSQAYGYGAQGGAVPPFGAAPAYGGAYNAPTGRIGADQGGLRTGWLAAFSTEGYEGEPSLLEELGVSYSHIQGKTLAVLNPFSRIDHHSSFFGDSDLAGPILFILAFGTFLLLSGKVHFGYIYGLALLGSISLHLILSLMSPPLSPSEAQPPSHHDHPGHTSASTPGSSHLSSTLTYPRSASILGYCLLPLVITSLIGIVMPMDGLVGYILTSLAIAWSTYSASGIFVGIGRMHSMRVLVAYPLALFYVGFGIMGIFSSRGSGLMGKVAAGGSV